MELYKLTKLNDSDGDITKRWFAFYSYVNPDTNKFERVRIWIPNKLLTKSSRYKRFDEIKKDIDSRLLQGWNPYVSERPELMTLSKALELYMTVKKNLVGHRMSCNYKCDIKKLTDWLSTKNLQNIPVNQFSTYHARNFMDDISTAKKYKNVTYNNLTRAYKTIFNFFIERELVLINPFGKITKLREEDAKIVAFSEKDWGVMYKNLPTHNPTLWLIANFIYYTAIRPSEIMRLKFEDIDLVRQKIICQGNKSKNHKSQIVEIPDDFQKLLEKTNWDYPKEWYIFSFGLRPGENETGPNLIFKQWKKFAIQYNIKERTIYNLKHNAAGRLIDGGFNARDIQMHFRHSSLDQTEIYINKFKNTSSEKLKHNFPDFNSLKSDN